MDFQDKMVGMDWTDFQGPMATQDSPVTWELPAFQDCLVKKESQAEMGWMEFQDSKEHLVDLAVLGVLAWLASQGVLVLTA